MKTILRKFLLTSSLLTLAPAPALAADAPQPVPLGELPDAATPSAYRLDLTVDPAQARFSGHAEIDARLNAPGRYLYISGRDLAVHAAAALVDGRRIPATWQQVDKSGVALLTFAEPLPEGTLTLAFDYDAAFEQGPAGFFHVKVGDQWYGWTQFESNDARAAYPSFDQPGYKQPFTVTLRTPHGDMAVSNAPETSVTQDGAWDVHRFAATAPLPTYLLAMMVGPFVHADGAVAPDAQRASPLPLRIVTTRNNKDLTAFPLENAPRIVQLLESYFGQSFPYPKLDLVTAPIMPGAMENAGADLFENSLLVMDRDASTAQKRRFGMVVAHELAHQWFGDLVTPAWWDDIWLNESFANWMGFRIGNLWRPDLNIGSGALAEGFAAMNTDALLAGRPIHQKIERTTQIDAAFDSITYGKGGQVVAMIAAFMGDDAFRDGVRRYMAAHRYGNATSAEFFASMAEAAGDPRILPAMQSFTDRQGVPLLTFQGADGHYTVTQSRYARLGTTPPPTHWGVPMCLRRGETRLCRLLDGPGADVTIGGSGALMPNAGGTGYYRFELPYAEWDRLIAASAGLPGGEALALADSLFASYQAGRAHASQLAELARVMAGNADSYADTAAIEKLEVLDGAGFFSAQAKTAYRALVKHLYGPKLAAAGFDLAAGAYAKEDPEVSQKRIETAILLADSAHDQATRASLAMAGKAWLAGNGATLDPAWYGAAFGVLAEDDGLPMVRALFARALASQDPLARPALLRAAAGSGKPEAARWLLAQTDRRLRESERLDLVADIAQTGATRDFAYGWIRDHLPLLVKGGAGIFYLSRLPEMLAGYCSVPKAEAMAHDFAPILNGTPAQLELERTVEQVRDCGILKAARGAQTSTEIAAVR